MRVTIRDVAKRAGCSISTVSLVLNNKTEKFTAETRERIFKAAAELGYRPNQLAVSLVKQRSLTLGLVVPDIGNQFFSKLAKEIEAICQEHGFDIILCNTNNDPHIESARIALLLDKSVDGLLLCMASGASFADEAEQIKQISKRHIPYCIIDRHYEGVGTYVVAVDHHLGAKLATQALVNAGHRRIACVTGPAHLEDSQARLNGYKDVLAEAGIPYDEALIFQGDYSWQKGCAAAKPLLDAQATAIFAFNDLSAIGLISGLRALGRKIPQDISVVGYDDSDYAQIYDIPLTTIHQPIDLLGQEAFKLVLEQIEDRAKPQAQILIPPYLSERASVAPYKK